MEVSDKENRKIFLENDKRQKSPHAVESLLLLDNTLLCNIESDNSIFAPNTCSKRYDSSQKHNVSITQVSKRQMQNIKTSPTVSSKISQSVSPDINEWQDESLMNQVFAQFEDEREIVLKNCSNINSFDVFNNTFCKEDTNSESSNVKEQIIGKVSDEANKNIPCQDKLTNISYLYITNFNDTLEDSSCKENNDKSPILKSKSRSLNEYSKPRKQLCLKNIELNSKMKKNENISPTKCSTFYDLPLTVKKLIQEIKGINELYRKL